MMNYTPAYARKLLEAIHIHEKQLKEKYDGELYIHIENMRSELKMINDIEQTKFHRSVFEHLGRKFYKQLWKPKITIVKN